LDMKQISDIQPSFSLKESKNQLQYKLCVVEYRYE